MQLEHCPFCGTNHTLIPDGSGRYQQIVCGACGARGPEVYRTLAYVIAVESWNVRQGPSDVNTTHRTSGVGTLARCAHHPSKCPHWEDCRARQECVGALGVNASGDAQPKGGA